MKSVTVRLTDEGLEVGMENIDSALEALGLLDIGMDAVRTGKGEPMPAAEDEDEKAEEDDL